MQSECYSISDTCMLSGIDRRENLVPRRMREHVTVSTGRLLKSLSRLPKTCGSGSMPGREITRLPPQAFHVPAEVMRGHTVNEVAILRLVIIGQTGIKVESHALTLREAGFPVRSGSIHEPERLEKEATAARNNSPIPDSFQDSQ